MMTRNLDASASTLEMKHPLDVITAKRFDIPIKTLYLRAQQAPFKRCQIFQEMYLEHLDLDRKSVV